MKKVLKSSTNKFRNRLCEIFATVLKTTNFYFPMTSYSPDKRCGANVASSLGFKRLASSPMAPVPVLVVYPAEDSAFQRAVVALAEFLQGYGGCSVAVDMWQQRKIAELGPMRWLAEKAKNAHRVLIVCPKVDCNLYVILTFFYLPSAK